MINWKKETSNVELPGVDFTASQNSIIVRKNHEVITVDDATNGNSATRTEHRYEMAFMNHSQYLEYTNTLPSSVNSGSNVNGFYVEHDNGTVVMNQGPILVTSDAIWVFPREIKSVLSVNITDMAGKVVEYELLRYGLKLKEASGKVVRIQVTGTY